MFFKRKPKLTHIDAIGLYMDGVCFVRVSRKAHAKPHVDAFEFIECDEEKLPSALKSLSKKYKLSKSRCATFLQADDYRLLITEAPQVPKEELVSAIQWDIKDIIDFPIENATMDVFSIPNQTGQTRNINVVAAKKDVIEALIEKFTQAKIRIRIIDIEELALRNIISTLDKDLQGVISLLIRRDHGLMTFSRAGELYFTRRIEVGSVALGTNPAMKETLALEVQRSIDYFERHFTNVAISSMTLLPFDGAVKETSEFLDKNLSLPCQVANLKEGIDWTIKFNDDVCKKYMITLGAALRHEPAAL